MDFIPSPISLPWANQKWIPSLGLALKTGPSPNASMDGPETHLPHQLTPPGCNSPHPLSAAATPSRRDKAGCRRAPRSRRIHEVFRLRPSFLSSRWPCACRRRKQTTAGQALSGSLSLRQRRHLSRARRGRDRRRVLCAPRAFSCPHRAALHASPAGLETSRREGNGCGDGA